MKSLLFLLILFSGCITININPAGKEKPVVNESKKFIQPLDTTWMDERFAHPYIIPSHGFDPMPIGGHFQGIFPPDTSLAIDSILLH